eukprot:gene4164-8280_t
MHDFIISVLQYSISTFINFSSVVVCSFGIYHKYCVLDAPVPVLFIALIFALLFLGYLEGLHFGVVSAQHIQLASKENFPRAHAIQSLVSNEANAVQRFLIGRQFFVVLVVFLIAEITTFSGWPEDLGPSSLVFICRSGLPGMLITLTFGQLLPQLLCEEHTIRFLNLPGCYSIIYLGLFIEHLGISHCSWLLFRILHTKIYNPQYILQRRTYSHIEDLNNNLLTRGDGEYILPDGTGSLAPINKLHPLEWLKFIYSTCLIIGCIAIIIIGIKSDYAVLRIPPIAIFVLLIFLLLMLFYLEGLMIAIVATQRRSCPKETLNGSISGDNNINLTNSNTNLNTNNSSNISSHSTSLHLTRADIIHEVCNTTAAHLGNMNNVKRFIMGRQCATVSTVFLISQMTVFPKWPLSSLHEQGTIAQIIFFILCRSGIPGALIVLSFSQLLPQLLAAEHPWQFMNLRGSFTVVILSLAIEAMGFTHFSRFLFHSVEYFLWRPYTSI